MKLLTAPPLLFAILLVAPTTFAENWLYTVRPGDTLWGLCQQYTNKDDCWLKLGKHNGVEYPRKLPPGFIIEFPVAWLKNVPKPVVAKFVRGDVQVVREKGAAAEPVTAGTELGIGAVITTGKGAVSLRFADGSTMLLEPDSRLRLDTLSVFNDTGVVDSKVHLRAGSVKTRVPKKQPRSRFQISTPAAVAAVRGTEFRVTADTANQTTNSAAIMRSEVFAGLVDIEAQGQTVGVEAGFGLRTQAGEAPKAPKPLLTAPVFDAMAEKVIQPFTVSWSQIENALAYQFEIFNDNEEDELLQLQNTGNIELIIDELKIACYRLRLRAVDDEQLQGKPANSRLCLQLAAPELLAKNVVSNAANADRPGFAVSWPAVTQANHYIAQTSKEAKFVDIVQNSTLSTADFHLAELPAKKVFVRVKAVTADGQESDFSQVISFAQKAERSRCPLRKCFSGFKQR